MPGSSSRLGQLAAIGLFAAACDGGPSPDDGGTWGFDGPVVAEDLPCDVDAVLENNCRMCHAATPRYGAPMPLTSWAALQARAVSQPSLQVYEMVGRRINDARRPMPPPTSGITLDPDEKAVLDAFVAAMGPQRPTGESCDLPDGGLPPGDGGGPIDELPCTPTHSFLAHAEGSDAPYEVPPAADNHYLCFTFRSPFTDVSQATAWGPVIDDDRVIHHWIMYSTATPQPDGGVSRCSMPADAQFVMGWAPGGGVTVMPPDVGMELPGPDEYVILQVHYWNVAGLTDARDRSGVQICATDTPRAAEAGVMWLGSVEIDIPARTSGHMVTGTCPSFATSTLRGPLNILSSGPHMHQLGARFTTDLLRGGSPASAERLVTVDPWDFNAQTLYPHTGVVLQPGDSLVTTCIYDNPTDSPVQFGERTEDEMCFNFITVYPLSNFGIDERRCVGF